MEGDRWQSLVTHSGFISSWQSPALQSSLVDGCLVVSGHLVGGRCLVTLDLADVPDVVSCLHGKYTWELAAFSQGCLTQAVPPIL